MEVLKKNNFGTTLVNQQSSILKGNNNNKHGLDFGNTTYSFEPHPLNQGLY